MPIIIDQIEQKAALITLPKIYLRLRELLDDPEYTMAEVVLLVSHDPALATRFLRVANSPLNRRSATIESVSRAVSLLGSQQVHDIVLCASVAEAFDGVDPSLIDMSAFWSRSVYCGILAKMLADSCDEIDTDRLFTLGLLMDLGHLFMCLAIPDDMQWLYQASKQRCQPIEQLERERLGMDYAEIGGHMLKKWGLPASFVGAIRCHLNPQTASDDRWESTLLHLSLRLVQADLDGVSLTDGPHRVDDALLKQIPIGLDEALALRDQAAKKHQEISQQIFAH